MFYTCNFTHKKPSWTSTWGSKILVAWDSVKRFAFIQDFCHSSTWHHKCFVQCFHVSLSLPFFCSGNSRHIALWKNLISSLFFTVSSLSPVRIQANRHKPHQFPHFPYILRMELTYIPGMEEQKTSFFQLPLTGDMLRNPVSGISPSSALLFRLRWLEKHVPCGF